MGRLGAMIRGAVLGGSCAAIVYLAPLGIIYKLWGPGNLGTGAPAKDYGSQAVFLWALICAPLPVALGALLGAVMGRERHDRRKKRR
jgi:hypothetical protein